MRNVSLLCTVLLIVCNASSASWFSSIFGSNESKSKDTAPTVTDNAPIPLRDVKPPSIGLKGSIVPVASTSTSEIGYKRAQISLTRNFSSTVVPVKHSFDDFLLKKIAENVQRLGSMTKLIFVGDSLFYRVSKIRAKWTQLESDYAAINLGSPGDRSEHILYRYRKGNVLNNITATAPLVVMMVGLSNANIGDSPTSITKGISATISLLKEHLKNPTILLLSLVPRSVQPAGAVVSAVNALMQEGYEKKNQSDVTYLDITRVFLTANNSINNDHFGPDKVTPNTAGQV